MIGSSCLPFFSLLSGAHFYFPSQTEMMSDAIDDAVDSDEAEEETDELTNQVVHLLTFFYQ
jgi:hypothetical protein